MGLITDAESSRLSAQVRPGPVRSSIQGHQRHSRELRSRARRNDRLRAPPLSAERIVGPSRFSASAGEVLYGEGAVRSKLDRVVNTTWSRGLRSPFTLAAPRRQAKPSNIPAPLLYVVLPSFLVQICSDRLMDSGPYTRGFQTHHLCGEARWGQLIEQSVGRT